MVTDATTCMTNRPRPCDTQLSELLVVVEGKSLDLILARPPNSRHPRKLTWGGPLPKDTQDGQRVCHVWFESRYLLLENQNACRTGASTVTDWRSLFSLDPWPASDLSQWRPGGNLSTRFI